MSNNRTVWKFEINARTIITTLNLPLGTTPLYVAEQHGRVQMWCLCDPSESICEERKFLFVGTGHEFTDPHPQHIGSILVDGGDYVFHVFEVLK